MARLSLPIHNSLDQIWMDLWSIFLFRFCKMICLDNFVSIKENADDCVRFKQNASKSGGKYKNASLTRQMRMT